MILLLNYSPSLRGLGYGSNVVALLSDKILREDKKVVNLFTDLTNSTSNSIYQKLGYVKIGQDIHFDFFESNILQK
jgi:predicted GNAT family acetyltransferase